MLESEQGSKDFFTGDLSIRELVLLKDVGFRPLGLVTGSSIFEIGFQNLKISENQELKPLTQAMYQARNMALARMVVKASGMRADGVIGVRLTITMKPWSESVAEFLATGTAVQHSTAASYLTSKGRPFTTELSGEDFSALINEGYRPLSFIIGNCVYQVGYQVAKSVLSQGVQNVELPDYTQAVADARELAMARMRKEGTYYGADGAVGIKTTESSHAWSKHIVEYFASASSILAKPEE